MYLSLVFSCNVMFPIPLSNLVVLVLLPISTLSLSLWSRAEAIKRATGDHFSEEV